MPEVKINGGNFIAYNLLRVKAEAEKLYQDGINQAEDRSLAVASAEKVRCEIKIRA